jgi:flavodoxin
VVFYSRVGENYQVGVIEEGNTAKVAKEIAAQTGAALIEVKPANAYPDGYDECCDVALAEQEEGARPELVEIPDLSTYDTIYLGYPIWWGDLPMFVYTLLENGDFAGKTIYPFCTHEGSGLSGTPANIAETCPDATVDEGMDLRGKTAQESPDEVKSAVADWLASL